MLHLYRVQSVALVSVTQLEEKGEATGTVGRKLSALGSERPGY